MKLYTPEDVANMLGVTVQHLAQLRYRGTGSKYVKLGRRVFYRPEDLEEWVNSNVYHMTGEPAVAN